MAGTGEKTPVVSRGVARPITVLRFGPNELDLEAYELRRGSVRIPLSRLPFDLLALLIQRRGTLVTREEIAAHLWTEPDLADTTGGINTAIKKIRGVLNDDATTPRYIETVIGRGYRFVGEVEPIPVHGAPAVTVQPEAVQLAPAIGELEALPARLEVTPGGTNPRRFGGVIALAAVILVSLLATAWLVWRRHGSEPMRTLEPVQITNNESDNRVEVGALSPNGRLLAYVDPDGVFVRELGSGATHLLKFPVGLQSDRVEWYPDDVRILISGVNVLTSTPELWALSVMGVPPRLIRKDARNGVPSPDGSHVAFTTRNDAEIWTAGADGENPQPFVKAARGVSYPFIFWGDQGGRLSYQLQREIGGSDTHGSPVLDSNYEWAYVSRSYRNGRETARVEGVRFESACETMNGRLFYLHTSSWRDGTRRGIWQVAVDANGSFRGVPEQLAATREYAAYGLSATHDGSSLAAVLERGQADVYIGAFQGAGLSDVHRLTLDTKRDFPHAWMPGDDAVIFESDRNGAFHLFRQELSARTAEQLTFAKGVQTMPQVTPDGRWILYEALRDKYPSAGDALERLPIEGGAPQPVALPHAPWDFACPLLRGPCILRELLDTQTFAFYELDPEKGKGPEVARTARVANAFGGWALSPDGQTIALPVADDQRSQIRLIHVIGNGNRRPDNVVAVLAPGRILNLNWLPDGSGWFAENSRNGRSSLVYVEQNGDEHLLRESTYSTWGVPSRNGRKIAFVDYTFDRNVWLWRP
jgi:eukaryotic-like serine/threonine-protein kinase